MIRNPEPVDDSAILDLVSRGYVKRSEEWIRWAIRENPSFREEISAVAEEDGKIVGTYLSATNPVKLGPRLVATGIKSLIVVDPEYRRRGIGTALVRWIRSRHSRAVVGPGAEGKVPMVRMAVASRETKRVFWSRLSKSPTLGESAVVFTRMVTTRPLEEAASSIDRACLPGGASPFSVHFDVAGFPPFSLEMDARSVEVKETPGADVEIRGVIDSPGRWSLVLSLVRGRLRLRGYRQVPGLFRYRRALYQFLSALQSEKSPADQLA